MTHIPSMFRATSLFACLLIAPAAAQAVTLESVLQRLPSPLPEGAPPQMQLIDPAGLARFAFHLASKELGGRHTGTPGQVAAAEFIAAHFESLGLLPLGDRHDDGTRGFVQHYDVRRTHLDPAQTWLKVGDEVHRAGFGVLPGTRGGDIDLEGRLVWCGEGGRDEIPEEIGEHDLPVVVLPPQKRLEGMTSERQFMLGFVETRKAGAITERLRRRGAKAVLLLDLGERLVDVMQYGGLLPGKPLLAYGDEMGMSAMFGGMAAPISMVVVGAPLAREMIAAFGFEQQDDGAVVSNPEPKAVPAAARVKILREAEYACSNVVAVLEGADEKLADEAIVYSAHMDHMGTRLDGAVFYGADDNGSGTAALLEIAEAFAKGERPKRSVIFLSVSGEELGLWGSHYFANHPTWPVGKLIANINIDMIGRATELSNEDEISATPSYRHPKFSSIGRDAATLAQHFDMELTIGDEFYERSDHKNFADKGIPVVFFCDGEHPDYHQVTDTPDKLDYGKMERVARLAFWTGWLVCEAEQRPVELGVARDWLVPTESLEPDDDAAGVEPGADTPQRDGAGSRR